MATSCPASSRLAVRCRPMNPVPPRISTFIGDPRYRNTAQPERRDSAARSGGLSRRGGTNVTKRRFVNRRSLMSPQGVELSLPKDVIARFPPMDRYLIGVSGGRDSVALLHLLTNLGYRRLIVCHLDHQLRGRSSTADAKFVRGLARKLKLECELGRINVAMRARRKKQSIETAGRNARYEFFARIARRRRCRTIFLGHHADDLVETFLLNLFRGAGPTGLSAMRQIAAREVDGMELTIVRPLLGTTRQEIDAFSRTHRLKYRDDATNQTLVPLRNRIRHRIIPYVEKQLGRKICGALWRAAMISADEAELAEKLVDPLSAGSSQLGLKELREQPRALQRRTIHLWLQAQSIANLDFETIERVRALVEPDARQAKTNLPRDRHARRRAGKLFIE
ncbi:MAG: tRNA lysidine(34) synthetase TilS [Verrucomicrobia bacterium]|nr:MAG: tRNA lysidine(34) synthetase TilS [Verrucomicrobiota bacterium]